MWIHIPLTTPVNIGENGNMGKPGTESGNVQIIDTTNKDVIKDVNTDVNINKDLNTDNFINSIEQIECKFKNKFSIFCILHKYLNFFKH